MLDDAIPVQSQDGRGAANPPNLPFTCSVLFFLPRLSRTQIWLRDLHGGTTPVKGPYPYRVISSCCFLARRYGAEGLRRGINVILHERLYLCLSTLFHRRDDGRVGVIIEPMAV